MSHKTELWTVKRWKIAIAQFYLLKQEMQTLDSEELWDYSMPELPSDETAISRAERTLGHTLHPEYRNFLLAAGGWKSFWHSVDLFGPDDLTGGPSFEEANRRILALSDEGLIEFDSVYPIAISLDDRTLFVAGRQHSDIYGTIVWISGVEVDRYQGFQELFLTMLELARRDLADLRRPDR